MKKMVLSLLNEAQDLNSIAFATFGTGNLAYPPKLVANAMYSAIEEFDAASGTGPLLNDVRIVVYYKVENIFEV